MAEKIESILEYVLGLYFHVNHGLDVEDAAKYVNNPNASFRKDQFKHELANAITNHLLSPQVFERITGDEYETQEEVDEFLKREIWQPIYGDESITI